MVVADPVARELEVWFGPHVDHGLKCLKDSAVQIGMAKVAGEMPWVGRTNFRVEIVDADLDSGLEWEKSGCLLLMAGMDAIAEYLAEFEKLCAQTRERPERPITLRSKRAFELWLA